MIKINIVNKLFHNTVLGIHKISVNDVEDKRRGKKLYPGDKVSIKSVGEYRIVK